MVSDWLIDRFGLLSPDPDAALLLGELGGAEAT